MDARATGAWHERTSARLLAGVGVAVVGVGVALALVLTGPTSPLRVDVEEPTLPAVTIPRFTVSTTTTTAVVVTRAAAPKLVVPPSVAPVVTATGGVCRPLLLTWPCFGGCSSFSPAGRSKTITSR